jgi:hypothetical protein
MDSKKQCDSAKDATGIIEVEASIMIEETLAIQWELQKHEGMEWYAPRQMEKGGRGSPCDETHAMLIVGDGEWRREKMRWMGKIDGGRGKRDGIC